MRISLDTKDSEQLRVNLGIGIIMGTGYSDPSVEVSEELKLIGASGYSDWNR